MNEVLFNHKSIALDSPAFELKGQKTIIAMGMLPGDYITFEIIKIDAADWSKVCGCRLIDIGKVKLSGTLPLLCPACEGAEPVPVRLTAEQPVVTLDRPQNTLLRAIYHGDGVDQQLVTVWAEITETPDLTPDQQGCYEDCEDFCEDESWNETGLHRCTPTAVEIQEVSNCGNYRWVECGPVVWTDTGQTRCTADGGTEIEQINQCNQKRWAPGPAQVWEETGEKRCTATNVQVQEANQCGDVRWVDGVAIEWTPTGETRCLGTHEMVKETNQCGDVRWVEGDTLDWHFTGRERCLPSGVLEVEQENQCGRKRWIEEGTVEWTDTGALRCLPGEIETEIEQTNQCGHRRWVPGPPQEWLPGGLHRCTPTHVEIEETNQCGDRRWVECGDVVWTDDGETRCSNGLIEKRQTNQCGQHRWVFSGLAQWTPTGEIRCVMRAPPGGGKASLVVEAEEVDECGNRRWVFLRDPVWSSTGRERCGDDSVEYEQTNDCGSVRWVAGEALDWQPTGVDACMGGTLHLQERNQCGDFRWTDTSVSCDDEPASIVALPCLYGDGTPNDPLRIEMDNCLIPALHEQVKVATEPCILGDGTTQNPVRLDMSCMLDWLKLVIHPGTGIAFDYNIDGSITINNTCCDEPPPEDSSHNILCEGATSPIQEGGLATFTINTITPVAGSPLNLTFDLFNSEQDEMNYPMPRYLTIPVGQSSGSVHVQTTNAWRGSSHQTILEIELQPNARVMSFQEPCFVEVNGREEPVDPPSTHTPSVSCTVSPVRAGGTVSYTITLDSPVTVTALQGQMTFSGTETTDPSDGFYTPRNFTIPVGQSSTTISFLTRNVQGTGTRQLTGTIASNPRLTSQASCTTSVYREQPAPAKYRLSTTCPSNLPPGQDACFTFTADRPVVGNLTFQVEIFGVTKNVTINNGQTSSGQVCEAVPAGTPPGSYSPSWVTSSSSKINWVGSTLCSFSVVDTCYNLTITSSPTGDVAPGTPITYTFTLDRPVVGTTLNFTVNIAGVNHGVSIGVGSSTTSVTINAPMTAGPINVTVPANSRICTPVTNNVNVTVVAPEPEVILTPLGGVGGCVGIDTPPAGNVHFAIDFRANRTASWTGTNKTGASWNWLSANGTVSDYEIRFDISGQGEAPDSGSAATGQWVDFRARWNWNIGPSTAQKIVHGTIRIRRKDNHSDTTTFGLSEIVMHNGVRCR